jgi:TPP-dependent 2-oxoacid decarboxylase
VIEIYHNRHFSEVLTYIRNGVDFFVFRWDNEASTPESLLEFYDGWDGYAEITEHEYTQILEIINKNNHGNKKNTSKK